MKRFLKIGGYILLGIAVLITGLLTYVKTMLPNVGEPPDIKIEITSERIERGRYLANHVMVCVDCHSTRDWSYLSGPVVEGTDGIGGQEFNQEMGFPGKYVAPNITPYRLGKWTDGEIFRAITAGVSKDGRALFPIMPHHLYGELDAKDVEDVIAYLRTLKAMPSNNEDSYSEFPMSFIINTIPKRASFIQRPPADDVVSYGKYLVTAAACIDCHTKQEKGEYVGELLAGGFEFSMGDGVTVRSANLTPDQATGIGSWTKDAFISTFKQYTDSVFVLPRVAPGEFQTNMPWTMYAGMTEADLTAIYEYLRSLPPIKNKVDKFTAVR